ncbi:hypothetical protein IX329_000792 [Fusobacterium necrophorum]|uniref:outer membrane protein assembly factor BamB family protein n=1 Tax=Fusobacterium necrophorum TaxID=859 RepID=UPI0004616D69|nr:PQQ-binding-like beta-propeller repeat protein [Fusobacterium necrophorum]KDE65703.1 hypothetical protein FUSO5_04290 [Fusobacterium necrophorum BFTR-1]KDE74224.1 hypothetical protein FUSO7_03975 [Fusobacterium necrophorum BFTR-2]MBR8733218.1 hypothetical protein [Fusobacterium necrophorum]MBR8789395.1 hypothetical protein [Fusobacterium necrophorum]
MKKLWTYHYQKGLRSCLLSKNILTKDNFLYFTLCYDKKGFYESLLLQYNRETAQARVLFQEEHVIGSLGIYENGNFYFTSMSGNIYCIGEEGEEKWKIPIGHGNADPYIICDTDRIYAANHGLYCINMEKGEIIWKNEEKRDKTACKFAINHRYIYHAGLDSSIRCINKETGKTVWEYGKNLYISSCTLIDKNI